MSADTIKCSNLTKWDVKTTMKFLKLYQHHDCLWNRWSKNYKDKQMRTAALTEICDKMNLPNFNIRLVISKIRILRTTYTEERKKMQKRYNDSGDYSTQLEWFSYADSFLKDVIQNRSMILQPKTLTNSRLKKSDSKVIDKRRKRLSENILKSEKSFNETINEDSISITFNDFELSNLQDEEDHNDYDESMIEVKTDSCNEISLLQNNLSSNSTDLSSLSNLNFLPSEENNLEKNKLTKTSDEENSNSKNEFIRKSSESIRSLSKTNSLNDFRSPHKMGTRNDYSKNVNILSDITTTRSVNEEGEFDVFGRSVACQLKTLPLEKAYELELKIQYLLTNSKLEAMGRDPAKNVYENFF